MIIFLFFIYLCIIISKPQNISYYSYFLNLKEQDYEEGLKDWFKYSTKNDLNLENPKTYNEKIQWIKLYDIDELKGNLTDKYLVRNWIKKKIGDKYLIPLLGVWDNFDEIKFEKLPEKFVLKCNHGSGMNIIFLNKNKINISDAKKKINNWMKINYAYYQGLELQYKNIKRKIIAEEYIENENNNLIDYKLWCFNGKVDTIMVISDRNNEKKYSFYDRDWNLLPFYYSNYKQKKIDKPKNLKELLHISEILSKGFIHVRTDFYILNNGTIKFGEMTFTPNSGITNFIKIEYNLYFGEKINLNLSNKYKNLNRTIKNKYQDL